MKRLRAFLRLSRLHFLGGGLLMFALGATSSPRITLADYLVAQLMVTSAQLTAHFVNEHADLEADRRITNRTLFSGGSGVLVDGALRPVVARRAALITSAIAVTCAAVVATWSVAAGLLGLVALAVSWGYSHPPVRLLETGWGEAATSVVVVGLVPIIGAIATGGSVTPYLWWAMLGLFFIHMAMMLAFELPDLTEDEASGKTVLAVRLGAGNTPRAMVALYIGALVTFTAAIVAGVLPGHAAALAAFAGAPMATAVVAAGRNRYAWLTTSAVAALVVTAAALSLAAPPPVGG